MTDDAKKIVVQIAHQKKERSVGAHLRAEGISFSPIAFTSLGLWPVAQVCSSRTY